MTWLGIMVQAYLIIGVAMTAGVVLLLSDDEMEDRSNHPLVTVISLLAVLLFWPVCLWIGRSHKQWKHGER